MKGIREEIPACLPNNVRFEKSEQKPSCKRCGGTGVIAVPFTNGFMGTHFIACPECEPKIRSAIYNARSGISKESYERYTLANFRASNETALRMKSTAERYLTNSVDLLRKGKGLAFWGASGNGKTHLCIAVLQQIKQPHIYWQYRREIQRMKNAMYRDGPEYNRLMSIVKSRNVLYIDDLFKASWIDGRLREQDEELMFDVINERYMNRYPTFFSSEYSLAQIGQCDEALASRIVEMVYPYSVEVEGENQRYNAIKGG